MKRSLAVLAVAMCLALAPVVAQDAPNMPMNFTAFAVNLNSGPQLPPGTPTRSAGTVQIRLDRFSSSEERATLVAAFKEGGQNALLRALQRVNPRVGFIRTPNSLGWDLRFAYREVNADGTSRIVIATDRRIEFWEARNRPRVSDFPFTLVEMHLDKANSGEGRMAVAARISTARDGETIEIENYAISPVILNNISLGR
jgi:hypothetical protein